MKWEIVIGLETHVQLSTASKIFSGSSTAVGAEPNTLACATDMALPGTLPVMNRGAVEKAILFGLAINADVAEFSQFERKHYFYPDLPKNYQTSQLEHPIVSGGQVSFMVGDELKTLTLTRAHLEEDAGKSLHENYNLDDGSPATGIDLNRTGTPLLEVVTEPDLRSAAEAVAYARALHSLVVWLGVCDGNMQEGNFRCDANVSVRPVGQKELGTRTEIKNVNSFRFLERAIAYEAQRQIEVLEDGGTIVQETRLYDDVNDETRSMRTKEDAQDYRYFPCPDLPPLIVSKEWIEEVRQSMPELPAACRARYESELGLSAYDAAKMTVNRETADYFEAALAEAGKKQAKTVANWIMGDVNATLNSSGLEMAEIPVTPAALAKLVTRITDGTISHKAARDVFQALWAGENDADVDKIIEAKGLKQISDSAAIEALVDTVLEANADIVEEYRSGKDKAFNSLVGRVMREAKGKANPAQVNEILKQKLG